MGHPIRVLGAALVVGVLVTAGCTTAVDGRPVAGEEASEREAGPSGADDSECTVVDAPLTDVEPPAGSTDETEPTIRVPQPDGWERYSDLDSQLIRFAMRNPGLGADGFPSTAVVTIESFPDTVDADSYFEQSRDAIAQAFGVTDVTYEDTTVCGLPAQTIDYVLPSQAASVPALPSTALAVVADGGDTKHGVVLTVQSPDPDNPAYVSDSTEMLDGFQVLLGSGGG